MVLSMFNQKFFYFRCKCSEVEEIVLSRLDNRAAWVCRRCGYSTDLAVEPYRTALEKERDIASEIDKQARQEGQKVERLTD